MATFKHILVPTDFEKASAEAVKIATSLAKAFDSQVTLLHVWEIPVYPYMDFMLNSTLIGQVEAAAVKRLGAALEDLQQILPSADSKLRTGMPWQTIADAIKELKPDLVVMGTHGRHGVSHTILGSVAERIVRMSPVPVLTVHAPKE